MTKIYNYAMQASCSVVLMLYVHEFGEKPNLNQRLQAFAPVENAPPTCPGMDSVALTVVKTVDLNAEFLDAVQATLWQSPEWRFDERKAHDLLTEELCRAGFQVTPSYVLPTGFRAEYARSVGGLSPCVCFMAEYDGLEEFGHTCGHNLTAEAALGATLALKAAFEEAPSLSGRVVCIGTPAEESGSGKVLMFKGGAFSGVDAVIMAHPSTANDVAPPALASGKVRARYTGRAACLTRTPVYFVNALDAAVSAYNAVSTMRQQIRPTWKVDGVISNGGIMANVIPDEAELYYFYHAPNAVELDELRQMLENCFQGAALATACTLDIDWQDGNEALLTNTPLADAFRKHAMALGVNMDPMPACKMIFMASSSIGMVSQHIPTIQPTYAICAAPNHSMKFVSAAGHEDAQDPTLTMAKTMALTGLELFRDTGLLLAVRKNFCESMTFQDQPRGP